MITLHRSLARHPLRLTLATLVLAVSGGLALSASAAPPPHGADGPMMMMMGGPGHIEHMLDQVDASADQRSQIQAIMKAAHADLQPMQASGHTLQQQLMQLMLQPSIDARAAEALRQQIQAQHDQSSKRMLQAMLDSSRVLSADQRKLLGDKLAQRSAMMERHRAEREALNKPAS